MDGAEYISQALQHEPDYSFEREDHGFLIRGFDETMNKLLATLYCAPDGNLHGYNMDRALQIADLYRAESAGLAHAMLHSAHIIKQQGHTNHRIFIESKHDTSDLWTSEERIMAATHDRVRIHNLGIEVSTHNLAEVLHQINKQDIDTDDAQKIADVTKQILATNRRRTANMFRDYAGIFHVANQILNSSILSTTVTYNRSAQYPVPKWMKNYDAWDDPIHLFITAIEEIDAFIALHEWVQARRLPYIPVFAPFSIENSTINFENGSLRADILLCGLHTNDIVPIQIKNRATQRTRDQYSEAMVIIEAADLDLPTQEQTIVRNSEGRPKIGHINEVRYGAILTEFLRQNPIRGKSKGTGKYARAYLDRAFHSFDEKVLPKINPASVPV